MLKANISWNAGQIAKAAALGSMSFNNAMQRNHVWDIGRKSKFIDSLLRGYAVPAIYTVRTDIDAPEGCKKGSKVFDCIDGKQRSEAIRGFLNNEYELVGLEEYDGEDINGKKFSDLSEEQQDAIKSYTMTVYYFSDITDDEIAEMMSRLNAGKPLTGVENARIKAKNLSAIITLGNHALFTENMTDAAIKSYANEDVVCKTALQLFEKQYELSTKNVRSAYEEMEFSNEDTTKLGKIFDTTKHILDAVKKNNSKNIINKIIKKTNLVNIIYLVATTEITDNNVIADFLSLFFNEKATTSSNYLFTALHNKRNAYNEAMMNGTNHASNVITRNEALEEALHLYISENKEGENDDEIQN